MNPVTVLSVLVKADGIAQTNRQLMAMQAQAERAAVATGEAEAVTRKMGGSGKAAAAGLGAAAAGARRGESAFGKFSARGSLALGRLRAFGPVGAIAGAAAVGMGVKFNDSMQKIVALVGVSQKQVNAWKKDLMALAPQVGKSPQELAEALYFLTSSGLSGADAMSALRISAKASAAGLGDMTKIADAISSAMNAYGAKTMTAAKATDILVATAKAGKAEPEELAATMGRVLPIASQMGVTFRDVGGAVASMSLKGLDAAESVTAVRQMLQALIKPTSQGREVLSQYGLSLDQVQQSLKQKGLLATLVMLRERFKGNQQDLAKLFNGVEGFNGVLSLTANGGKQAAGVFAQVGQSAGLTQQAFDQSKTAGFRFRQAMALASDAGIILANQLARLVGLFADNKTALTVLLVVVGGLAAGWAAYNVAQGIAAAVTQVTTGSFWGLNAAMEANPILLIVGLLAALAAGLVIAYQRSETFRNIVDGAFRAVGAAAQWLIGVWHSLIAVAAAVFGGIASTVGAAWAAVQTATTATWNVVAAVTRAVWGGISAYLSAVWSVIRAVLVVYFTFYREFITSVWGAIRALTLAVWNALKPYLTAVWNALKAAATAAFGAIRSVIEAVWRAIDAVTRAVWGQLRAFLSGAWAGIHAAATVAWAGIKSAIVTPVGQTVDAIKGLIGHGGKDKSGLVGWLSGAWATIVGGATDFAGAVKDAVVGAFKGVVGTVLKFAISILEIVGKIPGVGFEDTIKNLNATGHSLGIKGFARGGAFARTGGIVDSPITLMGEEAPRHPEFVIPTNPAHRGRARKLVGMAANAVGFATGGVFSGDQIAALWKRVGGPAGVAKIAGAVGLAESGGRTDAVGPATPYGRAQGLMQILGQVIPGSLLDPVVNMRNAVAKYKAAGGFSPWEAFTGPDGKGSDGPWRNFISQVTGGGGGGLGGLLSKIGGAIGGALSGGADALIGKLPGLGDLPDWLKGFGKNVLDQVGKWIKDKVGSLLGLGGGDGKPGGGGLGTFDGRPVANWIVPILNWARQHGWGGHITSGYRPPGQVVSNAQGIVAPQGHSNHNLTAYPGGAIDVGDPGARAAGAALASVLAHAPAINGRRLIWGGPTIGDWGHFSATGHAMGGMWSTAGNFGGVPFVGSYRNGGTIPRDGMAYVHKGETVTPAGRTAPLMNVEELHVHDDVDMERVLRRFAFAVEVDS